MELAEVVARHDERIEVLEEYQKRQNGALERLANRVDEIQQQLHTLYFWIMALLGSVVVQLVLTILGAKK